MSADFHLPTEFSSNGRPAIQPLLLAVLMVLFASGIVQADDWPCWMGPQLDGISREHGWSSEWPQDGLPVVWEGSVGIGFSSVSIVDGLLYTLGHADGQETVWCLNADNGRQVWSHSYPAELNPNLYEGGPGATPTVHQNHVYTLSIDGRLLCLDRRNGNVVWEKNLQQEFDVDLHEWGFDSSPIIVDDRLILQGGRIAAFHRQTGDMIWKTEKHQAGYGAVRQFDHDGRRLLASLDCDGLRISQLEDGRQVAFTEWKSPFRTNSTTPIIHDGLIYISTGYNVGCGLFELKNDQLLELYSGKAMRNHFNNSILWQDHLFGVDGNSNLGRVVMLTCMNFRTGEVKWKERGFGCGSVMIADGKLLVLTENGDLVLAEASAEEYHELARSPFLTGRCWTVPVLLNGRIYGRNAAGLIRCVQLPAK